MGVNTANSQLTMLTLLPSTASSPELDDVRCKKSQTNDRAGNSLKISSTPKVRVLRKTWQLKMSSGTIGWKTTTPCNLRISPLAYPSVFAMPHYVSTLGFLWFFMTFLYFSLCSLPMRNLLTLNYMNLRHVCILTIVQSPQVVISPQ